MSSKKLYYRRQVAESDAKSCWICFRPSSTVLITADKDDWFHVCASHLKDRKFATAQDEEDLAEKKRKEELDKEIEVVKKEYAERMRKKMEKRKKKKGEDEKEDKKDAKKEEKKEDEQEEKEKEDKLKELEKKKEEDTSAAHAPKIFELHKDFQLMRAQKRREAEQKRRNAEITRKNLDTLKSAGAFPSVPTGNP